MTSFKETAPGGHRPGHSWLSVLGIGLALWLLVGLVDTTWYYLTALTKGPPHSWHEIAELNLPFWILAGFLTPIVIWISRVARRPGSPRWMSGTVMVGYVIPFAVIHQSSFRAARLMLAGKPVFERKFLLVARNYVSSTLDLEILLYSAMVGSAFAIDYYRRYREKERAAAALELEQARLKASLNEARLEALKMHLQPHFLFNALHAISTLIMRGDSRAAHQMLLRLSQFLRMTLDTTDSPVVPLAVELEFLDAYLKIQRERFGDRLRVETDFPEETLGAEVPTLILQPLVENSIRHGIGADPGEGLIVLRAGIQGDSLRLEVRDNGPGLSDNRMPVEGVGLANIRARLNHLYPGAFIFTLTDAPGGGTVAKVVIPHRRAERRVEPA